MQTLLPFDQAVRARHSVRHFLAKPLAQETLISIANDAQLAPSNCNTQPWNVHIVSGDKREALSQRLLQADEQGLHSPDFSFDMKAFGGAYGDRRKEQGKTYYQSIGIARDDLEARRAVVKNNLNFYGAPHAAFLFMPSFGDNVRTAGDIGMYGQTFLLSLAARGLAGIPQTILGFYADTIREFLNISPEYKLLFGISFGYEDQNAPANQFKMGRAPLNQSVTFHD
ncbi:nitroreductase [Limnobaculum xujianqingii]|uniref:nitroreductase n=1 Tax=Limnobaculum xujianqingii TaxID=2738837 RepID=UPI001126D78D|nr:nitroreductase [Limnobaculum xujianqingii]